MRKSQDAAIKAAAERWALTSQTTLWELQGEAAARRGEAKVAPSGLRLTLQWAWLTGYEHVA